MKSASLPGIETFLLEIERPKNAKYAVIESDIDCPSKAIHVINFDVKDEFNIGRRVNNEISISDISVSRKQAMLKYEDG